jgi:ketosteroid isomerase-like protein
MAITPVDRATVESYYQAMRLGAAGATALARLFTDDAVYIEPFSGGDGQTRVHIGREVIAEFFRDSVNHRPPDMVVRMNRIDAEGDRVRVEWTCTASVLAEPMRGVDLYTFREGKIARLETTLVMTRSG